MKKQYQKVIASILAIIMVIALVLGLAAPFFAAQPQNIIIEAEIGFNQRYKVGGYTPISIFLKNNASNFNGELQIKIFLDTSNNENYYSIYSQKVDLPQGSAKKLNFEIVIPNNQDEIEISLVENKKVVAIKKVKTSYFYNSNYTKTLVGVLTDDENSMNIFKNLKVQSPDSDKYAATYSAYSANSRDMISLDNNLIFINKDSFPSTKSVLDNFRIIMINNYDTTLLNENQLNAIQQWIKTGGNLVIGTGQNRDRVLSGLKNIIDFNKIDGQINTNLLNTSIINMSLGKVLIHDFDLSYETTNDTIESLSNLYNEVIPNLKNNDIYIDNYNSNNIFIENDNPLIIIMLFVLAFYIIIVIPIVYIFLKRKDKLDKAWIVMPCIAVIATIIIFGLSFFTPYKNVTVNNLSFLNFKNNMANINTTLGIIAPKNKANLKFNKSNISIDRRYSVSPQPDIKENIVYEVSHENNESTNIKLNKPLFLEKDIIKTNTIKQFEESINATVSFDNGQIKCSISNNTGYNLEDCIVVIGGLYGYFESLPNNQSHEILINNNNIMVDSISTLRDIFYYDFSTMRNKLDNKLITKQKLKINMRRYNILSDVLRNLDTLNYDDYFKLRFFAFNNDNVNNLQVTNNNKEINLFNENIFFTQEDITLDNLPEGEEFDIPKGIIKVSSIYEKDEFGDRILYNDGNSVYIDSDEDTVYFEFKLPQNIKLDNFKIYWETTFDNPLQIYNINKNTWEDIELSKEIAEYDKEIYNLYEQEFAEHLNDYINSDNVINLKVEVQDYGRVLLPNISIKGSK